MDAWIDVATGTWGTFDGLVRVHLDAEAVQVLENASDSEIIEFGVDNGTPIL